VTLPVVLPLAQALKLLPAAVQSRQQLAVARVALVVLTLVPALAWAWVAVRATVRVLVRLRPLCPARRQLATTPKAAPLVLVNSAGGPAQQAPLTATAAAGWRQAHPLAARPVQSDTDECALVTSS
jgi:hypothetical protein